MSLKNFFDRIRSDSRGKIVSGMTLIAIALVLSLILGVIGCSGSHKLNPTDPVASKQKKQSPQGESGTIGSLTQPGGDVGRGSGTSGPDVGTDSMRGMLNQLVGLGGGQGGGYFKGSVMAGVFDAETREPISGAVVCGGNDGEISGTTNDEGYVVLDGFTVEPATDLIASELYITAGHDGYEMLSYSKIKHEVIAFLLNPLTPTTPSTATISGTFSFNTDNFLANAYATNVLNYVDGVLQPSGPGDENDTYELTVEAGKSAVFLCIQRNPVTGKIMRFYSQRVDSLGSGTTYEINGSYDVQDLGTTHTSTGWIEYGGERAALYHGIVLIPGQLIGNLDSLNVEMMLYNNKPEASLPFTDRIQWITYEDELENEGFAKRAFSTTYMSNFRDILPFDMEQVWIDADYNDGSGSYLMFGLSGTFERSRGAVFQLYVPPEINSPANESLGVGLTPTIQWTSATDLDQYYCIINLVDTENGNRWRIYADQGARQTTLPTLCDNMTSWGLAVGNQVSMAVENDLTLANGQAPFEQISSSPNNNSRNSLKQRNYSGPVLYTP